MAKKKMYWFYNPPKPPKPKVPESIKIEVKKVGDELFVSKNRFNLSYMRHTGKWWGIYPDLTLDECIEAIRDEPHFMP
ncbi:hypothetical protein C5S29_12245 [ANME-1 cluster archaeon GoMg3.2]|nr:hypothetical protein [ANME-1 cluster archaeon GoMg3.2]